MKELNKETCPRCGRKTHDIAYRSEKMDMKWCQRCINNIGLENIKNVEDSMGLSVGTFSYSKRSED